MAKRIIGGGKKYNLVCATTGSGKSMVLAVLAAYYASKTGGKHPVLILSPHKKDIGETYSKLFIHDWMPRIVPIYEKDSVTAKLKWQEGVIYMMSADNVAQTPWKKSLYTQQGGRGEKYKNHPEFRETCKTSKDLENAVVLVDEWHAMYNERKISDDNKAKMNDDSPAATYRYWRDWILTTNFHKMVAFTATPDFNMDDWEERYFPMKTFEQNGLILYHNHLSDVNVPLLAQPTPINVTTIRDSRSTSSIKNDSCGLILQGGTSNSPIGDALCTQLVEQIESFSRRVTTPKIIIYAGDTPANVVKVYLGLKRARYNRGVLANFKIACIGKTRCINFEDTMYSVYSRSIDDDYKANNKFQKMKNLAAVSSEQLAIRQAYTSPDRRAS
jgi:hypothetical protein